MLENREINHQKPTRSYASAQRHSILVNVGECSRNDGMRSGSGTNSRIPVLMGSVRPANNKNLLPGDFMRQTRAAAKRSAMDDSSRMISTAPNPHAKKRSALTNLSNNANVPALPFQSSMPKVTDQINVATVKTKSRTLVQARDVETQMACLSVVQKKEASPEIDPAFLNISPELNIKAADKDENVPPEKSKVATTLPPQLVVVNTLCSAKKQLPIKQEKNHSNCKYTDIDNHKDPQMCSMYATDIYAHLQLAEIKRRPATNFMEVIQQEINASMRGILVDWLVEVAEEYKLVPDTLYLAVSYIDRFLSTNPVNRQHLQLLGVSCMLIAAKYEEICAPQIEEFCYITDNTYGRDEVVEMERQVLNNLHFELTTPTTKTFLRRFVRAAHTAYKVTSLQLEFLSNYLAELSLVEYSFLQYLPSTVAASAVFLAKLTLEQNTAPWNATLQHYTGYKPLELKDCVQALFDFQCNIKNYTLPAITDKYRQHKFKCVANLKPPNSLPPHYFLNLES